MYIYIRLIHTIFLRVSVGNTAHPVARCALGAARCAPAARSPKSRAPHQGPSVVAPERPAPRRGAAMAVMVLL